MQLPKAEQVEVDLIVQEIKQAKRPIFWIGGGTLKSVEEVKAIADLGIPIVSSTHARGVLADDHPRSLGAFHNSAAVEQLLKDADLLVVVGSRLRSNETKTYSVQFPTILSKSMLIQSHNSVITLYVTLSVLMLNMCCKA